MQESEIRREVVESHPQDWFFLELIEREKWVYTYYPDVRIRLETYDPWGDRETYTAEWAQDFLGEPISDTYYLYFNDSPVYEIDVAIVENGNVTMPVPNIADGEITEFDYRIGQIVNSDRDRFDICVERLDLDISEEVL